MKKEQIKAIAATILASNAKMPEVFMTWDGQGFSAENRAEAHQGTIDASKKVIQVKRAEKVEAPVEPKADESILDLSVPKLTEALQELTDVDALTALLEAENAKGDAARSTAVKAIKERLEAAQA
jgi:hypothetical protein